MALSPIDRAVVLGHRLKDREVRIMLSGFLAAELRERWSVEIEASYLERLLAVYVQAVDHGLTVAEAVIDRKKH